MIIALTTPYNPGDADPGKTYTHLHIDVIVYSSSSFTGTVTYDLGTCDAQGIFTPGRANPRKSEVTTSQEFAGFCTAMSPAGEPAMVTSQRLAYQFLMQHRGIQGTIDMTLPFDPDAPSAAVAANDVAASSSTTAPAASTGSTGT